MEGGKDAPGAAGVWQYISLPRGAEATAGAYLENRILRGERPCDAWSIAGRQNFRTISMVSSDVRNCQMSKANPYDSFPNRIQLLYSNGSDRRYSRPDGLIRAQHTLDGEFDPGSG